MKMEEKAGGDVGSEGGGVRGVEGVGGNTPTPFHTHWFCLAHTICTSYKYIFITSYKEIYVRPDSYASEKLECDV